MTNRQQKMWTENETNYLIDHYGNRSVEDIAESLGRTKTAIVLRAQRIGLRGFFDNSTKYIPFHTLIKYLGMGGGGYKKESWKRLGFPFHKLKRLNQVYEVVNINEFWKWAYDHQYSIDFSNFERNALGPEPDWVEGKRLRDIKKKAHYTMQPWTPFEDHHLRRLLSERKYTYRELSRILQRTEGALCRRIVDLKIKERPVKENNHNPYSEDDWNTLCEMIKAGENYEAMSEVLDRSAKSIRGRVFDMYLTENLDKVRKYIGNGKWGDNRPIISLRYMRLMKPEEKGCAKSLLSDFAAILLEHAKNTSGVADEFRDYFQKDMCMNWDDIIGCTAGETSCDSCTHFQRIQPQFCKRCGCTFFERKENNICEKCRVQRKKSAARKYFALKEKRR